MTGQTFKWCGCRAADGGQPGGACPQLRSSGHGTWWYRVDIGPGIDTDGLHRQRRQRSRGGFATNARRPRRCPRSRPGSRTARTSTSAGSPSAPTSRTGWPARGAAAHHHQVLPRAPGPLHPGAPGHLRLSELRTVDVERMYAAIAKGNAGRERPGGPATMRRIHVTLQSALNTAVKRRAVAFNPAAHVELAAAPRPRSGPRTGRRVPGPHRRRPAQRPVPPDRHYGPTSG